METKQLISFLRYAAISGNILFILWVSFNAINEGFSGTLPEKASYVVLMGLLVTNCFLLITKFQKQELTRQHKSL
jgi:hypothetical protein